jgi:cell division protease FtsH
MLLVLAVMLVAMWAWQARMQGAHAPGIDYSVFYALASQGKVKTVVLQGQDIEGEFTAKEKIEGHEILAFHTMMPRQDEALLPLLREKQVQIRVASEEPPLAVSLISNLLPWVIMIGVWIWLSRRAQRMMTMGGPLGGFLKGQSRKFEKTAQVSITFDDVAGLKGAKRDLQEVVGFLKEPERFKRLGGKVPRGVLLIGPPGTGKTLLARAVAGESGVPFYSISASEFIEMFVGVGAARVRDLFEEAKKNAPSIVFIDEIDAVGRSRGSGFGGGHDEREQTLNQLLSEMDGFARNDLTIVIAATNRPDVLDPALLRPGRFDRRVIVDRPEFEARRSILKVHTKLLPLAPDVDLDVISRNTPGFSGADLANLANEAALGATRRGVDAIAAEDFTAAYDKIVLGDLRESKLDPTEKHRVAVHESGHTVVAHFSPHAEPLHRVTIIPRGMALGVTQQTPPTDRHIMTQPELESRLGVLMGGFAAERIVLGNVSTGAENDLKEATRIATKMVANYGMSSKLGAVYYEHEAEHPFLGQRIATDGVASDATVSAIESEARAVLTRALESASQLIERNRAKVDRLVEVLLEKETVEGPELTGLLGASARTGATA